MSFTLAEASKYSRNKMKAGVLEELIRDSMILQKIRFIEVTGNAFQYTRENSMGTADFYDANEIIAEDTGDVTSATAALRVLAGDADIDNFLKKTRSDITDFEAGEIDRKAKALKWRWMQAFWYGNATANAKEFDGIQTILNSLPARTYNQAGALSINALEDQWDSILGGMPDGVFMPKRLRTLMTRYFRGKANIEMTAGTWGDKVKEFNDVPIFVDDHMTLTEAVSGDSVTSDAGGATMSAIWLSFDEDDVVGLQNGGLQINNLGQLESKDSHRWRLKWYTSAALQRTLLVGRAHGITNVAVVD